jgi:hypothetical protein
MATKERGFPFIFSGAFSEAAATDFSEASANGLVPHSRLVRAGGDLFRVYYRALRQQGYSPLDATHVVLKQIESMLAQMQPQPQAQPQPPGFVPPQPAPFQAPINGGKVAAHG